MAFQFLQTNAAAARSDLPRKLATIDTISGRSMDGILAVLEAQSDKGDWIIGRNGEEGEREAWEK